ncbi:hypothetical protein Aperf_G00000130611 [Anoplocephala perfoliata]
MKFVEELLDNPCHDDLAMRLSNRVLISPQSAEARLHIRVLGQLRLSLHKPQLYKDLLRTANLMLKKAERHCILTLHRFKKNIQKCITASGLKIDDFLQDSPVSMVGAPSELPARASASPTPSEDQPTLLGPPEEAATKAELEDVSGAPRLSSTLHNEQVKNTLASLSFRGPPMPSTMLVFTDDEDEDEAEVEKPEETEPDVEIISVERSAEKMRTPTARRATMGSKRPATSRPRVRRTPAASSSSPDKEKMPPSPAIATTTFRRNTRSSTIVASASSAAAAVSTRSSTRRTVTRSSTRNTSSSGRN